VEYFSLKRSGTYSNYWALRGYFNYFHATAFFLRS